MRFLSLPMLGAFIIEPEVMEDERGFFARTFCRREFADHGLDSSFVQCSISFNSYKGTLRGMHYQEHPHDEAKLVRCVRGAIYDVALDLRPESPTYLKWYAVELNEQNRKALYLPAGFAHGFLTLCVATEVTYQISAFYAQDAARGVRWNDPAFGIEWPAQVEVISDRDRNYPDFEP